MNTDNPKTVVVMTRPGLLYGLLVNVGYLEGTTKSLGYPEWVNQKEILEFLAKLNITFPGKKKNR